MNKQKLQITVTLVAIIIGFIVIGLWLLLPFPLSPHKQAPVSSEEFFLLKMETELDTMRILLALKTNLGFIEAQDPAERIRDLCFNIDNKEGLEKWNTIVADMNSWYIRLAVNGSATLKEVLEELYAKYPFLRLEGITEQNN